ncbi:3-deoxy-D-manno-octulosonate 8-phosphate phosphatase KdsC [Thalassocella blandensis]|nr:3-deoxy-D-manno-octulosonate 8-phosphate phosphatase KdsC [Thalassocella blandensis]
MTENTQKREDNSHFLVTAEELNSKARDIRMLLLDVDGVLTDGKLYFNNDAVESKTFNTLDGHGIKMLQASGVRVGIITGRTSKLVEKRASDLGITLLVQGREDKYTALQEILSSETVDLEHIAFMGDDYPDLTVMTRVGLSLTVPNAHAEVIKRSHWQSQNAGGHGAVREACDLIMKAQNTYSVALEKYINA